MKKVIKKKNGNEEELQKEEVKKVKPIEKEEIEEEEEYSDKLNSNDVLDILSIKLNDVLKTTKKDRDKKDNSYFWLFKLILLIFYVILLIALFNAIEHFGVAIIYAIGKSLRSVLSIGWVVIIRFMKGILVLYTLYNNVDVFTKSKYYSKLYAKDKPMLKKKKSLFNGLKTFFRVLSVFYLIASGFVAALALFITVLFIKLAIDGVLVVSPIVIFLSLFAICFLSFKHIQNKFFGTKPEIPNKCYLLTVLALVIGVAFFGYETSGYEYKNTLPLGFETIKNEQTFDASKVNKIVVKADTKLDNMKLYIDETLDDEIRVEVEYFNTTEVSYSYKFNNENNLYLTFTSELKFELEDIYDVARLASATFNNNTIYNYNLFKYPNINIYASKKNINKIVTEHN